MLTEFIGLHREQLLDLCAARAADRCETRAPANASFGTPVFLECLIQCLALRDKNREALETMASGHGAEMLKQGLPVGWLNHEYADLWQAITQLAASERVEIPLDEFAALSACMESAIGSSVRQYEHLRLLALTPDGSHEVDERIAHYANELRELIDGTGTALRNDLASGGSASLHRSLDQLRAAVERKLAVIRVEPGLLTTHEAIAVSPLLADLEPWAQAEAVWAGRTISFSAGAGRLAVRADRAKLLAALRQLVRSAIQNTPHGGQVQVRTRGTASQVHFEIEDQRGGMTSAQEAAVRRMLERPGVPPGVLGLDRAIGKRNAEELGGRLRLRVHGGKGCEFAIELPRYETTGGDAPQCADAPAAELLRPGP